MIVLWGLILTREGSLSMPKSKRLVELTGNLLGKQQCGSFYPVGSSSKVNILDKLCSKTGIH